jgi:hypothetical protein
VNYNRAFIIRNDKSLPLLKEVDLTEDSGHWLFDSGESFHGEYNEEYFYFKDSRIDSRLKLPIDCIRLEFTEVEELPVDNMEAPCVCDCGIIFDLDDGNGCGKCNKVLCKKCITEPFVLCPLCDSEIGEEIKKELDEIGEEWE